MEFLVEFAYELGREVESGTAAALLRAEAERGAELARQGHLRAIWRIPGRRENRGLWSARDATELHELLTSLPLWPHATVSVTALAEHALAAHCRGLPPGLDCGADRRPGGAEGAALPG